MIKLSLVVGAAALVAACSKTSDAPAPAAKAPAPAVAPVPAPPPAPARPASSGWYHVVLGEKQGTAIPFFLQLPASGDAIVATGAEQIHGRLVSGPPKVDVEFDIYHTKIDATADDHGVLDGTWSSSSKSWGAASLSFHAEPIAAPAAALRFPVTPGGPDPVGVWKIGLTKPGELAKLVLSRDGDELVGQISFQSGNLALVAGSQDGRTIRLSSFDGSSPYLFVAKLDEPGKTFEGSWIAGQALDWKETLHGKKTADFTLAHPLALVGKRPHLKLPELDQPPYRGQPVIVELSGSWCPACGHATVELRALHDRYAAQGLQILTLAYEFTDDHAYNAQQADAIKTKFHLPWNVVPIDGGLEKYNDILPAELSSIDAAGFPIAIFVARDGGIEGFHSGFPPDSAAALHQQTLDDYDRLTQKILAR